MGGVRAFLADALIGQRAHAAEQHPPDEGDGDERLDADVVTDGRPSDADARQNDDEIGEQPSGVQERPGQQDQRRPQHRPRLSGENEVRTRQSDQRRLEIAREAHEDERDTPAGVEARSAAPVFSLTTNPVGFRPLSRAITTCPPS
jgi:hypothetical protein